jgi:hypothetical protein
MGTPDPARYLANLNNYRIQLQNDHVMSNYNQMLREKSDIDRIALQIRETQVRLNKMYNKMDFPDNEYIRTIKSMEAPGRLLSVVPTTDKNIYQMIINGQCLTNYGRNKDAILQPCNSGMQTSDSQKFYTTRILNPAHAASEMPGGILTDNTKIIYPYNIFRSNVSDKCVSIDGAGAVYLQNCSPNNIQQQWKISPNENICLQ